MSSKSKEVEARDFGTLAQCAQKRQEMRLEPILVPFGSHQRACQLPHYSDEVIWLISGRPGSTFGVWEGQEGFPSSKPLPSPLLHLQLSATFTIPFWQWFLTRFGKKTAVYIGISVSGAEGGSACAGGCWWEFPS